MNVSGYKISVIVSDFQNVKFKGTRVWGSKVFSGVDGRMSSRKGKQGTKGRSLSFAN